MSRSQSIPQNHIFTLQQLKNDYIAWREALEEKKNEYHGYIAFLYLSQNHTLQYIADLLGITKQRVSKIIKDYERQVKPLC